MTDYNDPAQQGAPAPQPEGAPAAQPGAAQQPAPAAQPQGVPAGAAATPPQGAYQQPGYQAQPGPGAAPGGPGAPVPPQPQSPYGAAPVPPQPQPVEPRPVYAEGCVKAALNDLTASEGWKGRMVLLGLIGCVPILNFVVYGYGLNWSREVPFGAKTPMPRQMVSGRNFEIGFYYFVIALVVGLVVGIASAIVGWVPLLGWAAALALMLFSAMFTPLLGTRMAMMGSLGEGFQVGRAWDVLKRNWTGLLAAGVLPDLVVGLVLLVVGVLFMGIGFAGMIGPLMALSSGATAGSAAMAVGSMGIIGFVLVLVWYVLCAAGSAMATIVSLRAVAHWVGRYAPEWAADAWRAVQTPRY